MFLRELYVKCSTTGDDRLCNFKTRKKVFIEDESMIKASGILVSSSFVVKAVRTDVKS